MQQSLLRRTAHHGCLGIHRRLAPHFSRPATVRQRNFGACSGARESAPVHSSRCIFKCSSKLICVLFVCSSLILFPCSHIVLFGRLTMHPPRDGSASRVSPQSCQSHGSLWVPCYSLCSALSKDHLLYYLCDRADDSSI